MCKLTKVGDLQIFKRKNPSEKLDKIIGLMFLEIGNDSKVFETIYFSRIFLALVYIYSLPRENELRERIPVPHDIFFKNLFKVRAHAAKVIFVCCFRDPRGLLSRERDMFRRQTFEV